MTKDKALEIAIEALETAEIQSEYDGLSKLIFEAINACKEALEQPTQEPVAWMNDIAFSMDKELLGTRGRIVALYTHPHQWVGLTDDEIWDIANFLGKNKEWDYPVMFAKTIEKVLREKNDEPKPTSDV
jgi:hypothetical protein